MSTQEGEGKGNGTITIRDIPDQPQKESQDDSKPEISFILTMFNIVCNIHPAFLSNPNNT